MPHLTLEHTANLTSFQPEAALTALNRVLLQSGQFSDEDIKSRALALTQFRVGSQPGGHGFIHVTLSLLSGRSPEVKRALASQLLTELQGHVQDASTTLAVQLSVDVRDLDRDCYAKLRLPG